MRDFFHMCVCRKLNFLIQVIWLNPKGKKMKESSRIKFGLTPDGGSNTFTAQLELKVWFLLFFILKEVH